MSTPTPPLTDVATPMEVDVAPTKESAPPPTKPTQVLPKTAGPKTYSKTTSAGLDSVICYPGGPVLLVPGLYSVICNPPHLPSPSAAPPATLAPPPPANSNAPSPPPNFNAPLSLDPMEIMTEAGPLSAPLGKQASPAVSPTSVSPTPAAAKKNMPPPLDLPPPMVVREKKREHGALSDLGEDTKRKKVHFKVDERSPSGSPLPAPKTKAEETGGYPHRNPSPCSDDENWRVLYHDGYQTF
jgi:hypothetical protein